jgi:hypothetical protein
LKDWLLGTQVAPTCEAGAFIRGAVLVFIGHAQASLENRKESP